MQLLTYTPQNLLSEIVQLLVGGISGIATGIGDGLSTLAQSVFIETSDGSLTVFGSLVVIFAGVSLAIGLSRYIVNFLTSWGK